MRSFALMMLIGILAACNHSTTVTISIPDIDTSTMTSAQIVDYIGNAIGKGLQPGLRTSEVEQAVDRALRQSGFAPSRDFVGFCIGEKPHMFPRIPGSLDSNIASSGFELDTTVVVLVLAHAGNSRGASPSGRIHHCSSRWKDSVL